MIYRVASFTIDTIQFEIKNDAIAVAVEPKVFDLIVYLIQNRDRLVSRDELFKEIWQGREVSDTTLSNSIKSARKILGDSGEVQHIIKTVRGRGYHFIADVVEINHRDLGVNDASPVTEHSQNNHNVHLSDFQTNDSPPAPASSDRLKTSKRNTFRYVYLSLGVLLLIIAGWQLSLKTSRDQMNNSRPYIVVLPFEVNGEQATKWQPFADQMTRDVIRNLRKISGLNVVPVPSAFAVMANESHEHIREQLPDVDYSLTATINVWADSRVQVIPELENLTTKELVWDQQYESRIDDTTFFSIKSELATSLSESLKVAILDTEKTSLGEFPTDNLRAYELYVLGQKKKDQFTRTSLLEAVELYSQAIALDPEFEAAYVAKADAYRIIMAYVAVPGEVLPQVIDAVADSLRVNPESAEARSALGLSYALAWRWQDAWEILNQAREINPEIALTEVGFALYYSGLGDVAGVKRSLKRANQLDPLNVELADWGHWALAMVGEIDAARQWAEDKIRLHPTVGMIFSGASVSASLSGDHRKALALAKEGVRLETESPYPLLALAQAYGYAGQTEEVLPLLKQAEMFDTYLCRYENAITHLILDDLDKTFEYLNKAVADRSNCLVFTRNDPRLEPIRSDKRYQALLMRIGLDDRSLEQYPR